MIFSKIKEKNLNFSKKKWVTFWVTFKKKWVTFFLKMGYFFRFLGYFWVTFKIKKLHRYVDTKKK